MTAIVHSNTITTRYLLPTWILRLVGVSSFAVALVNLFIYCRHRKGVLKSTNVKATGKSTTLNGTYSKDMYKSSPYAQPPWWGSRLVDNVIGAAFLQKKKLTISLKNTILWNPSPDVTVSNHAFHENALALLTQLCLHYDVYLLIHTNNENDLAQIRRLLAPIGFLDSSRIIYCQDEWQKVDLVQNVLKPVIHVEGGWELDDGEEIIRALQSSVQKLIWVITRRRRVSFNEENIKPKDKDLMHHTVELTDSLMDSSLAREAGFQLD